MQAGLNLYSIRNYLDTEEHFLEAAQKLREMGYSYMQYSGGAFDPDRIARVSSQTGLPVVLTHVPMNRIVEDTQALMEEHDKFGCKNIGLGAMPPAEIADENRCKAMIEQLDRAGEIMKANGFSFFYHHHHFEFIKHGGETVIDYMIKNAKHINFTADTYWLQFGGVNILDYLDKLKGRIECVHLKDYGVFKRDNWFEPKFTSVGDGNIDFVKVVAKMKELGVKYYLVEQDNAADLPDTLAPIERSIKYINNKL